MITYKIIQSKRKSIAIVVKANGEVEVRAPHRTSKRRIQEFVDQKSAWILEKQALAQEMTPQPHKYTAGELFYYLGKTYPLEIVQQNSPALTFTGERFLLSKAALPRAKEAFTRWYQQKARRYLNERAAALAIHHGLNYTKLRLSSARTRWGSCSSLGTLSLTWRLILTPPESIDYVIVHELAHLLHKNHSKQFWDKVAEMMPDYAPRAAWLKQHSRQLSLE